VYFSYSPRGQYPLEIAGYLLKQICTNGAVSTEASFRYQRRPGKEDPMNWLSEMTSKVVAELDKVTEKYLATASVNVDNHVSEVVRSIYERYHVPLEAREYIDGRLINEGATSLQDVIDAITWVASHPEAGPVALADNPRLTRRLMAAGGAVSEHPSFCQACHRVFK
jgi:hypothetical protein